jgi:hypothetical protein
MGALKQYIAGDHNWHTIDGRNQKRGYNRNGRYPIGSGIPRQVMVK